MKDRYRRGNDFSDGEAKIGEKNNQGNQIQHATFCNTHFSKKVGYMQCTMGCEVQPQKAEAGEFSVIFVLKVTIKSLR